MAAEPYNPVPTVAPAENAPNDTLRVNPTPASFGGLVAQGAKELGQGAQAAGQFFGKVAADQATNTFQDQASALRTQYLGLTGQAAMDALPAYQKKMDDLLSSTRSTLTTPEQQLDFDANSRRLRTYLASDMGTHYDQQTKVWMGSVHDQKFNVNNNSIASDPSMNNYLNSTKDMVDAAVNKARLQGTDEQAAIDHAKQVATVTRINAIAATDPDAARTMMTNYRTTLGDKFAPMYERINARADQELGIQKAGQYGTQSATELASQPIENRVVPPLFAQATEAAPGGFSPKGLATTIHIESGGDPNATHGSMRGLGQFSPATWAQYGQGSPYDPEQALLATQRYAAANAQYLTQALGRKPTDGEIYIAHQQGPAGAASLIANPQMPAAQALLQAGAYHTLHAAQNAIVSNGGDPNAPAANFVAKWTARFGGPGGAVTPFGGATAKIPTATAATVAPAVPASDLPVTPAAFTSAPGVIPPPLPPPPSPAPIATPADTYARTIQLGQEDPAFKGRPRALAAFMQQARETYTAAQLASEADARAQKERSDQATLGYTDTISKLSAGQLPPDQRAALVPSIYANHALTLEAKNALASAVTRAGGGADETSYGPAYVQALAGLTAPYGSPDRISGPDQIVQLYASGAVTSKGRDDLMRMYGEVKRDPETAGVAQSKSAFLASYKAKMVYDAAPLYPGQVIRPDKEGEEAFDAKFLPAANSMYDKYVAGGGNPYDFMLDPKNVKRLDDLANSIRPKKAVDAAYVSATGDPADVTPLPSAPSMSQAARGAELGTEAGRTAGGIAVPREAPPPAPPDVDAGGWSMVMQTRPVTDKGAWNYADWAKAVQYLQAHPDTAATFDKHFPNAPTNAAAILSALRPKTRAPYGAPPPPPEPVIVPGL